VADAADLVTSYALVNGRRTVYMPVTKRADASTLAVVDLVKRQPAEVPGGGRRRHPGQLRARPVAGRDPCHRRPGKEGALGALLTGFMVLVFLRDWRSALVVVVNIPSPC
jgi:multidrug efflux pump subunit AcrB